MRLVVHASACITESHALAEGMWAPCLLAFLISLSFLAGFLTQLVGVLFVLTAAAIELFHPAWSHPIGSLLSLNVIVIAAAICLLGPGAFSLDAHFFGRRKIIIPSMANP
jgi:putative oxidoreductase